eukprot:9495719-Pyramimonas_sp.AAC.1
MRAKARASAGRTLVRSAEEPEVVPGGDESDDDFEVCNGWAVRKSDKTQAVGMVPSSKGMAIFTWDDGDRWLSPLEVAAVEPRKRRAAAEDAKEAAKPAKVAKGKSKGKGKSKSNAENDDKAA